MYDPTIGRFLSTDPLAAAPTDPATEVYDYALQNHVNNYDLEGTCAAIKVLPGPCWIYARGAYTTTGAAGLLFGLGIAATVAVGGAGSSAPSHTEMQGPTTTLPEPVQAKKKPSENTKGARPSTKEKHEKGKARKKQKQTDMKRTHGSWRPRK
jgi:hypothetical protein